MVGRVFWRRTLAVAAATVLFSSIAAGADSPVAAEGEWATLIRHFRTKAQIAPAASVRVVRVTESALGEGARAGVLQVGEGPAVKETAFVASPDGRFVVFGAVEDVTLDPAAAVMSKIQLDGEIFRGPADATVTVVEYSDFQCPFCAKGYRIIEEEVLPGYAGKIRFFYKHLPLPFHPWAEAAAVAMECVKLQSPEASWKVYDALFQKQRQVTLDNVSEKVFTFAGDDALVRETFDACVAGKDTLGRVRAQAAEAASLGISGTPSFVINGRIVKGAQPPARFRAILDDELRLD
jgi:protein-disulfide isomerase